MHRREKYNILSTILRNKINKDFGKEFAIYDLNEFLASVSLFDKPSLDFKDDFVVMTEDGSTGKALKYWYSDPSVVTTVSKEITMPECEISFSLENDLNRHLIMTHLINPFDTY